jgi:coenzyme F420-reducing hydrogenase beta subunit
LELSFSQFPYWAQLAGAKKFLKGILEAKNSDAVKEFVVAGKLVVEPHAGTHHAQFTKSVSQEIQIDSLC